ncbi:MAG: methyltransferase domain-containing protein [Chloroflexi bacterium]|nr:methyltransferase domain-containing protein [Chloroflexota bacterium]
MRDRAEHKKPTAYDLWGGLGITEHPGGVNATRRLIALCGVRPGQNVLVIGCGTGHTACLLAKEYGARVVALDVSPQVLRWAGRRVAAEGVSDRVILMVADAQNLPFAPGSFDAAVAESVLMFCDQAQAATEARRVLKPGGVFGDNELTYLKPPPDRLRSLLSGEIFGVRVRALNEVEWKAVFAGAGFARVTSVLHRLSVWEQLWSHLQIDGVRQYLTATIQSLRDPTVRSLAFNLDVLRQAIRLVPYVGYGLYVCRNAPPDDN